VLPFGQSSRPKEAGTAHENSLMNSGDETKVEGLDDRPYAGGGL